MNNSVYIIDTDISSDGSIPLYALLEHNDEHQYMIRYQFCAKKPWILFNIKTKEIRWFKSLKACIDFGVKKDWIPEWDAEIARDGVRAARVASIYAPFITGE